MSAEVYEVAEVSVRPFGNLQGVSHRVFSETGFQRQLTSQHRVDHFECLVDFFSDFGTRQDNLSANEDQEYDFRFHHAIDETGEKFRLVGAEVMMAAGKTFQTDRKLDIARSDNILDFEICKFGIEAKFLDNTGVFSRCQFRVVF